MLSLLPALSLSCLRVRSVVLVDLRGLRQRQFPQSSSAEKRGGAFTLAHRRACKSSQAVSRFGRGHSAATRLRRGLSAACFGWGGGYFCLLFFFSSSGYGLVGCLLSAHGQRCWTTREWDGHPMTRVFSTLREKISLTRVTDSFLLALGTTQISSYFTKHWTKFLTHQTRELHRDMFRFKPVWNYLGRIVYH